MFSCALRITQKGRRSMYLKRCSEGNLRLFVCGLLHEHVNMFASESVPERESD